MTTNEDAAPVVRPAADHERHMRLALRQAEAAAAEGEVPVGAVIVRAGRLLARRTTSGAAQGPDRARGDPRDHAGGQRRGRLRLGTRCLLTRSPASCAPARSSWRDPAGGVGLTDPLRGGAVSLFQVFQQADLNHRVEHVAGVLEAECAAVLKDFFKARRAAAGDLP